MEWLTTISSVIIGALIGFGLESLRKKRDQKENEKATKALIELELTRNKKLLKNYWTAVSKSAKKWHHEETGFDYSRLASTILDITLPTFRDEGWKSQLRKISKVYNVSELRSIWKDYDYFQQLEKIRNHIAILDQQREAQSLSQNLSNAQSIFSDIAFGRNTSHLAESFKKITEELIGEDTVLFKNKEGT